MAYNPGTVNTVCVTGSSIVGYCDPVSIGMMQLEFSSQENKPIEWKWI